MRAHRREGGSESSVLAVDAWRHEVRHGGLPGTDSCRAHVSAHRPLKVCGRPFSITVNLENGDKLGTRHNKPTTPTVVRVSEVAISGVSNSK